MKIHNKLLEMRAEGGSVTFCLFTENDKKNWFYHCVNEKVLTEILSIQRLLKSF